MDSEIVALSNATNNPEKPVVAILGGAIVSDKINVILALMKKANAILIGGAMANTFLAAKGYSVGFSKYEEDKLDVAKEIMEQAEKLNVKLVLPVDVVAGSEFSPTAKRKTFAADAIADGYQAMDIGKKTCKLFANEIKHAKTVIWNGPMGVFEFKKFRKGTLAVAKAVAKSNAVSIVGGGDSVAAIQELGFANKITHLSTGGGAEGVDIIAVWQSLTNQSSDTTYNNTKIARAHLPIASKTELGAIKIGDGLAITSDGTISSASGI